MRLTLLRIISGRFNSEERRSAFNHSEREQVPVKDEVVRGKCG